MHTPYIPPTPPPRALLQRTLQAQDRAQPITNKATIRLHTRQQCFCCLQLHHALSDCSTNSMARRLTCSTAAASPSLFSYSR